MSRRGRKDNGPRSDDDRLRARLEREQRRAQREGRAVPQDLDELPAADATPEPTAPSFDPPSGTAFDPPADGAPVDPPVERTPDPPAEPPAGDAPWWSAGTGEVPAVDVSDALSGADRPPDPPPAPRVTPRRRPDPEPFSAFTDEHDPIDDEPLTPLRPSASAIPPITVAPRKAPARRGWSRIAALLVLVPLIALGAAAVLLFQPFKGDPGDQVRVTIPAGSSVNQIGELLAEQGVIDNALAFSLRARLSGGGADLRAGTIELRKDMSYGAALTALRDEPLPDPVVNVGVPEGLSRREIAAHLKQTDVTGDYMAASRRSAGFDPKRYGQPRRQTGLEGFLFPATYELPRGGATSKALVAKQVEAFTDRIASVDMRRAKRAGLSVYEVLIIASMIEREINVPDERRKAAAVIYNRLDKGMTLGIDATIRYAERNWTRPLRVSELQRDGPYNTRTRTGLPPTPIGNPGLASIKAAANPAREDYLFYVVKPCGNGAHAFSTNDQQFERDRQAYERARQERGGDPSRCDGDDGR